MDVGQYGDLSVRSAKDGLTPDHIPSFGAIRENIERTLGRSLTPKEAKALRNKTNTIMIPTAIHRKSSRTYGGRNTKGQIAGDANNLAVAALKDQQVLRQALINAGFDQQNIDNAFNDLDNLNRQDGLY
ncbi:hypothetical protein U2F10_11275 [Leptothoe sp. EHU-05/26/07-4]